MARVVAVDDPGDPRLVELTQLTDAAARRRLESDHGCFVAEGLLALEAVTASPYPLRSVLVSESRLDRVLAVVGHLEVDVLVGSRRLLQAVAGYDVHRGVLASVGRRPPLPLDALAPCARLVAVEGVNDHENVGALFRNAAAFGAGVVLGPRTADPLYRRAVRVSLGHVLRVPWTSVDDLVAALRQLAGHGFEVCALTPRRGTVLHELARDERRVWLVGAERSGLSAPALAASHRRVRIAMAGGVDSLNVATAAAIALAHDFRAPPAG